MVNPPRPLVLCILDGFGERAERDANAIKLAKTPTLDVLYQYPHTTIGTSGPDVGLPIGQMGNSEVGHLNFGAGRIAMMDITRIDLAITLGQLGQNPWIRRAIENAHERSCRLHLFGLVSDGGVHSSMEHLRALIDAADQLYVKVVVHAFLDGRDTPPSSAMGYIETLEEWLDGGRKGVIGTMCGRYWAMDRDKRWDRVQKAYDAMIFAKAPRAPDAIRALRQSYDDEITDEFVEPVVIGDYQGLKGDLTCEFAGGDAVGEWRWVGEEPAIAFNFRPDRMRELCAMLSHRNLPPEVSEMLRTETEKRIVAFDYEDLVCMTDYDASLKLPVAFPKEEVKDSFGEVIARAHKKQLRCAETEKYAHVTYFFSGGREAPFDGEDRKLVPSPRDVPTYDKKPEMSAAGVAREVAAAVRSGQYDFILVNFANPDMVGHTGVLDAAVHAVEAVDAGLGEIVAAVREKGGALLLTSDHGNCEQMKDSQGRPHTAHTTNPVPLIYMNEADKSAKLKGGGRICDVAPTMLEILGMEKPRAMTGQSLLVRDSTAKP